MQKILYIGEKVTKIRTGADAVNDRNIKALKQVFGDGFFHYELQRVGKKTTFINALRGNSGAIRESDYATILSLIEKENIDKVFLWSSKLGRLASKIKKQNKETEVISFFHNIEKQYYEELLKLDKSFKNRLFAVVSAYNERLAAKHSDKLITLNSRDSKLLKSIYGRTSECELPTSFEDRFDSVKAESLQNKDDSILRLLFVGSSFFANNQGLQWFIENVLPGLDNATLTIVGKGMDSVFQNSGKVEVHGFVDDLAEYYYKSDVMVEPIFCGGGMKTKTAEAMMYGCPIVGTTEAFEGYDVEPDLIGGVADTADSMTEAINRLRAPEIRKICRQYSRQLFSEKYSLESSVKTVAEHLK